jgi:hypothetical protein
MSFRMSYKLVGQGIFLQRIAQNLGSDCKARYCLSLIVG